MSVVYTEASAIDFGYGSGLGKIDRIGYFLRVGFDDPPVLSGERDDRDFAAGKVLLVFDGQVPGQEDIEAVLLRNAEQITILPTAPTHTSRSVNLMKFQIPTQLVGQIFVEQNLHGTRCP